MTTPKDPGYVEPKPVASTSPQGMFFLFNKIAPLNSWGVCIEPAPVDREVFLQAKDWGPRFTFDSSEGVFGENTMPLAMPDTGEWRSLRFILPSNTTLWMTSPYENTPGVSGTVTPVHR